MKKGAYDTSDAKTDGPAASVPNHWAAVVDALDVAFQPIVNTHTGQCFGCEVLLRGFEAFGHPSVLALLDAAHAAGMLAEVEVAVRRRAADKWSAVGMAGNSALFLNLDARMLAAAREFHKATRTLLGDKVAHLVTEVAGRSTVASAEEWLKALKKHGSLLAVDRFGEGRDSLRLVHEADPDFIKIDRYYVGGIDGDARKRVMLAQVIGMAHTLGVVVIAVGVETERELMVCRELGCDMVQGNFVEAPLTDPWRVAQSYPHVEAAGVGDRRRRRLDQKWIVDQLDPVAPVDIDAPMPVVFDRLARDIGHTVIPVVDKHGQPLGIVRERNLKNFAYSNYGKDLMANKGIGRCLRDFLVHCPMAEMSSSLDQILAIFSTNEDADGIIITEQMRYLGFLSARSIIRAIHEKTLAHAREENPLTKLPGNDLINDYVAEVVASGEGAVLAYVDFDNFKPFNDTYGFRQGDRAILLFAELMRKAAMGRSWLLGHIGGDDFFIGIKGTGLAEAAREVAELIGQFASDAESFYDAQTRERGCIVAQDREGKTKTFPLLSASAVLVEVPTGCTSCTIDDVSVAIAARKKEAKTSPTKLAFAALGCSAVG